MMTTTVAGGSATESRTTVRPGSTSGRIAVPQPPVIVAADQSPERIRTELSAGRMRRVGFGIYVPTTVDDERGLAVARAVGIHERLAVDHVFSHTTAAVLHGLRLNSIGELTHVRQAHSSGGRADRLLRRHTPLPESRGTVIGLPVTDLRSTVWDCLTTLKPLDALVVADHALRLGILPEDLLELDAGRRRSGTARARSIVALADGGSESVRETMLRFALLRAGLPVPTTQVAVETRRGTYWSDLGWPGLRLLVEYDGLEKYAGREREALLAEKLRRDALAEAGWRTVHITKADGLAAMVARVTPYLPAHVVAARRPRRELIPAPRIPGTL